MRMLVALMIACIASHLLSMQDESVHATHTRNSAVTFRLNGGRLGDNLLNCIKSLWFAYTYGYDFIVMPFRYYEKFALSRMYPSCTHETFQQYPPVQIMGKYSTIPTLSSNAQLYQTTFRFCSPSWEDWSDCTLWHGLFDNPTFRQMIRDSLAPLKAVPSVVMPQNIPTVALHVRKGGGFDAPLLSKKDRPFADVKWPLRFVPDSYYIEQLCYLSDMLGNVPLYVHLFTDDPNPKALAKKYTKELNGRPILFGYREEKNTHKSNVLEDLFSIAQCDYLIRPESSYSKTAHLVGSHKMVIFPLSFVWEHEQLMITEVVVMKGTQRSIMPTQYYRAAQVDGLGFIEYH